MLNGIYRSLLLPLFCDAELIAVFKLDEAARLLTKRFKVRFVSRICAHLSITYVTYTMDKCARIDYE